MNQVQRLRELLSDGPRQIVTVDAVNTDGSSLVSLRTGDQLRVAGDTVEVGQKAIIQAGRIIGRAPDLPFSRIEV